jgi:VanZ family protein
MRWIMPLSIISASLYGVSDEIHQSFVPYRHGSFTDVIADILGAVCGVYLYHRWKSRKTGGSPTADQTISRSNRKKETLA